MYGVIRPVLLALQLTLSCWTCGCFQYHHLTPPPPLSFERPWDHAGSVSLTWSPGEGPGLQAGYYLRAGNGAVGAGFSNFFVPTSLSYIYYDPIGNNSYLTYELHLNQFPLPMYDGGYNPMIEGGIGILKRNGTITHSASIGLAYMNDLVEYDGFLWDPISTSTGPARTGFLPSIKYSGDFNKLVYGAAWYPGMTRHYLLAHREPLHPEGSVFHFTAAEIDTLDTARQDSATGGWKGTGDVFPGDYVFRLNNRHNVRIMYGPTVFGKPSLPVSLSMPLWLRYEDKDLYERRRLAKRERRWVVIDTIGEDRMEPITLNRRLMDLDIGQILETYRETGSLLIREDPEVMEYLRKYPIPSYKDMIFSVALRSYGWKKPVDGN